jgi:hypothetical protein
LPRLRARIFPKLEDTLQHINKVYAEGASELERLYKLLEHQISVPYDPTSIYQQQGRAVEAGNYLRQQIRDHKESLGSVSPARQYLISVLALLLLAERNYGEAEKICCEAFETALRELGPNSVVTIGIQNFYIRILYTQGAFSKMEKILPELIERKQLLLAANDDSVLNSRNDLSVAYYR